MGTLLHNRSSVQNYHYGKRKKITIETDGNVQDEFVTNDPFAFLAEFKSRFKVAEITDEQRFSGGLVGYFSYDTVRFVETKLGPADNKDEIDTPDILLMLSEELVVFDNLRGTISFIINVDPHEVGSFGEAQLRLDRLQNAPKTPVALPLINGGENLSAHKFRHHFSKSEFEAAVESIKEYIVAGDVMQVVLAQRMSIEYPGDPINVSSSTLFKSFTLYGFFQYGRPSSCKCITRDFGKS